MKFTYNHTTYACYLSSTTSAVINNFAPLLFVAFTTRFGISLNQLSYIIILNFGIQMFVDFFGAKYVDRIGYRTSLILAHIMSALGLVLLGTLPYVLPAYSGILISVLCYAIGSGLLEVLTSPTIEALPSNKSKEKAMSLLHSFYCWGSVLVVCLSTLYFRLCGIENWRYLCFLWAILPLIAIFLFSKVPIVPFGNEAHHIAFGEIFKHSLFWIFASLMLCSGAAELAMSQWASLFAEKGLGVSKTFGDLLGPCFFAVMMGIARALYGKYGDKLNLVVALLISGFITISGYILSSLSPDPVVSLMGCGVCGFGVAIMWPGILSLAAKHYPEGGTAIFGLLAMSGDIGCWIGPFAVARVSSYFSIMGSELKAGLLFSSVFPFFMILSIFFLMKVLKERTNNR